MEILDRAGFWKCHRFSYLACCLNYPEGRQGVWLSYEGFDNLILGAFWVLKCNAILVPNTIQLFLLRCSHSCIDRFAMSSFLYGDSNSFSDKKVYGLFDF